MGGVYRIQTFLDFYIFFIFTGPQVSATVCKMPHISLDRCDSCMEKYPRCRV